MLLHSHFDFQYILKQPIKVLIPMIYKARQKQDDQTAWQMWLALYPQMTKKTFINFEEYKQRLQPPKFSGNPKQFVQSTFNKFKAKIKPSKRKEGEY